MIDAAMALDGNSRRRGEEQAGPLRRCFATGEVRPKDDLVRFVVSPAGDVVPDIDERLPGRGLWLKAERDIVAAASAKGLFAKAARGPARAAPDLADWVEELLARRCRELLGLARRAGQAAAGFEAVRGWLTAGKVGLLLEAADAAPGGRAKLRALARNVPVVAVLRSDELGSALGRGRAVHVAVAPGSLARRLMREALRLSGFRGAGAGPKAAARGRRDEGGMTQRATLERKFTTE